MSEKKPELDPNLNRESTSKQLATRLNKMADVLQECADKGVDVKQGHLVIFTIGAAAAWLGFSATNTPGPLGNEFARTILAGIAGSETFTTTALLSMVLNDKINGQRLPTEEIPISTHLLPFLAKLCRKYSSDLSGDNQPQK